MLALLQLFLIAPPTFVCLPPRNIQTVINQVINPSPYCCVVGRMWKFRGHPYHTFDFDMGESTPGLRINRDASGGHVPMEANVHMLE